MSISKRLTNSRRAGVVSLFSVKKNKLSLLVNEVILLSLCGCGNAFAEATLSDGSTKVISIQASSGEASSSGPGSIAIGSAATASSSGLAALAVGYSASANGSGATAIGRGASAAATNALALGNGASSTLANSVALGSNSTASAVSNTTANTVANSFISGKTLSVVQAPTNGVVAIGNRQIQGVADGQLSSTSTDAVNGAQLYQVTSGLNSNINAFGSSTASALGGGAAYNSTTGAWTAPSYTVQGSNYSNIGDAFGGVDRNLTALNNSVSSGSTGVVQRTGTANVATLTAAGGTASAPGEAQTLTNLAEGKLTADSTDAVNGSQLYAVADQVSKNTTDIAGLTTIVNNATESNLVKQSSDDNSITIGSSKAGTTVSVAGTEGNRTLSGVADGVAANDAATVGQLQGVMGNISSRDDTGLGVAKATGQNGLAVGAGSVASGDFSTASGAGAQATAANSSASGSGAKATAVNATALGQGATASGASTLAAGQGSSATGSQTVALGAGSHASGAQSVALGYGSVADRDNSVSVGSVGHERQVTNIAAGTARTDAANVGQVNDAFQSLGKSVNKKINDLDDKLTGGIASAMAMSGIPQAYQPNSSLVGASASTYNGQSAISVGVSKTSEDGTWIFKVNGSGNTQSDFGASVGVGYQW